MFEPSSRQQEAVLAMEKMLSIRRGRSAFTSAEEFQSYWDSLSKRCARSKSADPRQVSAQRQASAAKSKERIAQYYQQPDALLAYAKKYYLRYFPSFARLLHQLRSKCNDPATCAAVGEQVQALVDDRGNALNLALRLQDQGRAGAFIRNKLRLKQFSPAAIDDAIAAISKDDGSTLDTQAMERKIVTMRRRGLSSQAIRQRLGGNAADRPHIEAALQQGEADNCNDDDKTISPEATALQSMITRLQRQGLDEKALIRRLQSRGFRYALIRQVLDEQG